MAIQMRRGKFANFIPSKLLPGEYAVVQGDDPSVRDGRSVYMAFAAGVVKRLATYEDMVENVSAALVDAIGDAAERLTERAEAINAAANEGEASRRKAEEGRASAEAARATAESSRASAERGRATADADRETRQAKNDADQAQNNAAAMGMTYHVCSADEYARDAVDGLHNVPTVTGKPGTMYLTPRVSGATGEDRYDQWLCVDGAWELMGETGSHIEPVTTGDVDAITAGTTVTADRYLNATGLTYWWAKSKSALASLFAAKSHTHAASAIASGTIDPARLPPATTSSPGAVSVGDGLTVSGDGALSVDNGAYVRLLWSGKTQSEVTLRESCASFRAIVAAIGGSDGVVEASTLVWVPDGKTFDVAAAFVAGNNDWRSLRMRFEASGDKLTPTHNLGQIAGDAVDNAYLLYVVGVV